MVALRNQGVSVREISRRYGIDKTTAAKYLTRNMSNGAAKGASEPGEPPPPAHTLDQVIDRVEIDGTVEIAKQDRPLKPQEMMDLCGLDRSKWIPQNFKVNKWQGFARLKVDGSEKLTKVDLYQSKLGVTRVITEELEEGILRFVRENVTALPKPLLKAYRGMKDHPSTPQQMCVWGLWDTHIGSYAWNSETRNDWDVDMACCRVCNSIDDMVAELTGYPFERIVMPIGNDFMHFDSSRMKTTFGEHYLDTDTRYARVFQAALSCLSYLVERALELCDNVELLYVPGNHDKTSSFCLTAALAQRYREDERVKVDLRANPRKYVQHGGTLIGFDHGDKCRSNQFSMIMSTEAQEMWATSTYREVQVGHTHQRRERQYDGVVPTNGLLIRTNPSLCNIDAWHHDQGLIGEPMKSVEAYRYDHLGFRGSHVAYARDDKHPKAIAALKAIK